MLEDDPISTIKYIMSLWPKDNLQSNESLKTLLSNYLTSDFEVACFGNVPKGKFSLFSKPLILRNGNEAKILVYDSEDPEQLNMAILVRGSNLKWQLKSFWFQCSSCFGTGMILNDLCGTCGATGWGLAEY